MGMFAIFNKLGGTEEVMRLLKEGAPRPTYPSRHTLEDWKWRRRKIPPLVVARLQAICEERGIKYRLSDFELPPREGAAE
jgi:hypothetical protein